MLVDSVPFRLCVWFVNNRGKALFTNQACDLFDITPNALWTRTKPAIRHGWLRRSKVKGERETFLEPGPKLLEAMK